MIWKGVKSLSFLGELTNIYIPSIRVSDFFEIAILIFLIYKVIMSLKNTRAMIVLKGILILFIFYNLAYLFSFEAIVVLFQSAITILIFALIVVFQPEMRRFLEQIGTKNITGNFDFSSLFGKNKKVFKYYSDKTISELTKACFAMGDVKTGALIVIERDIPLTEYIDTGIALNADLTSQLLINIFEKNTPLHDGAVIQIKDKIIAATCYLPLSNNPKISKHMGTRHRAAIGLSEVTDCIVLVVSEETGKVSLVVNGEIQYNLTKEKLTELLYKYQSKEEIIETKKLGEKVTLKSFLKKENLSIRLVSVLVGIFGWVLLMNVANPLTTVTIENVPIEFINTSVIENTGKTFELLSSNTVDVTVTDERSVVDSLRKEDVSVIADLSKLSYVNAVPLQGFVEKYPTAVVKFVEENTINLELDSVISKEVEVELQKRISEDSKTYVPVLNSDVSSVIITGGKTKIDTIDKVVCTYDVTNAEGIYNGVASPVIYDKNGNPLSNDLFKLSIDVIEAEGIAYPIKEIPIEISVSNKIVGGLRISNLDYIPKTIKIAGDLKYLESLNKLNIQTDINIDSDSILNNQFVKTISILDYLPDGVYFAELDDEITLTINFEALKTKTITFNKEDVAIIGNLQDYNVKLLENNFKIIISGENSILEQITKDTIIPYIDVTNLTEGHYNMIMQFEGLDNVILTSNISVKLSISKDSKE